MRLYAAVLIALAALARPAAAQNIADNAGRWWMQPQGGEAFRLYNPLTALYGRIGLIYSFNQTLNATQNAIPNQTITANDQFGAILGLGARLMPIARIELQAGGLFSSSTTTPFNPTGSFGRMRSVQVLTNFYLDGAPLLGTAACGLNPYVFGGLGISFNTWTFPGVANGTDGGHTRAAFAWNVGLGLQYQVMESLILDLGYRYIAIGRFASNPRALVSLPTVQTDSFTAHQIMFTLIVPFAGLTR